MFANLAAMRRELIGIALAASIGIAQSRDLAPRPKFEVASIRCGKRFWKAAFN